MGKCRDIVKVVQESFSGECSGTVYLGPSLRSNLIKLRFYEFVVSLFLTNLAGGSSEYVNLLSDKDRVNPPQLQQHNLLHPHEKV